MSLLVPDWMQPRPTTKDVLEMCRHWMGVRSLHIVDGDSTGGTLRHAGFSNNGLILSWRDALYSGPVPEGLDLRQLSRLRSRFWSNGKRTREFVERDADLARYAGYDELVLWFGSDCTLCQLSLLQILAWLQEQKKAPTCLSWVKQHGGILKPQQTLCVYARRKPITSSQVRLADRVWRAFCSPSPLLLDRLLSLNLHALPGIRNTIRWILREYPAKRGGLSRLQRRLLKQIEAHGKSKLSTIVGSVLSTEWVGDLFLFDLLKRCIEAEYPLVRVVEPSGNAHLNYRSRVALTNIGRRVLAGNADHIALNGIDRWIGGVHLIGHQVHWRWDHREQQVCLAY